MKTLDKAVLRLKKQALLDIINVWVEKNFVSGAVAVSVEPSTDGEQYQITIETKIQE